jgi:hypothetical protein
MPRTIVDLPSSQLKDLDARCRSLRISRAEAVRRAIHAFLRESPGNSERGFGLWKDASSARRRVRAADEP